MVDFSDIMPIRIDAAHMQCPVCDTGWYTRAGSYCPACSHLYNADKRNSIFPPALNDATFTLKIWQKYRLVERLHREGRYTVEQMKKLLHEVDEYAINEFNERQNEQKKRQAEQEQRCKQIQDLGNRNNYSY